MREEVPKSKEDPSSDTHVKAPESGVVTNESVRRFLRRRFLHDNQVHELRGALEDLHHRRPHRLKTFLVRPSLLPFASLLLAFEDDEHVDLARVLLVPHGGRAHKTGARLFESTQLFGESLQPLVVAGTQARPYELCP